MGAGGDGSLSLDTSLSWEDLGAESAELLEYADRRLEIEDMRFICFGVGATGCGGAAAGLLTGFLRIILEGDSICEASIFG